MPSSNEVYQYKLYQGSTVTRRERKKAASHNDFFGLSITDTKVRCQAPIPLPDCSWTKLGQTFDLSLAGCSSTKMMFSTLMTRCIAAGAGVGNLAAKCKALWGRMGTDYQRLSGQVG